MKIVIDIPDEWYEGAKGIKYPTRLERCIKEGQPLSETLDKIRAEIEKLQKMCDKNNLNLMAQYSAFGMVLDIIDKHKGGERMTEAEAIEAMIENEYAKGEEIEAGDHEKHHCSLWSEYYKQCSACNHPCPDNYECLDFC